jgi:hypothetical protein
MITEAASSGHPADADPTGRSDGPGLGRAWVGRECALSQAAESNFRSQLPLAAVRASWARSDSPGMGGQIFQCGLWRPLHRGKRLGVFWGGSFRLDEAKRRAWARTREGHRNEHLTRCRVGATRTFGSAGCDRKRAGCDPVSFVPSFLLRS